MMNFQKVRNNRQITNYIISEHENHKLKKEKLKLGLVTFEIKNLKYGNLIIHSWFEMVFSRQRHIPNKGQRFQKLLVSFKWSWDLTHIITASIFIALAYDVLSTYIVLWFNNNLKADSSYISILLKESVQLLSNPTVLDSFIPNFHSIRTLSNYTDVIIELSTYFGFF